MDVFSWITSLKTRIDFKDKIVFVAAFVTGLLCHLFVMVGHYPCYSGIYAFISDFSGSFREGRWMQVLLGRLDGNTTIPMYIGVIALLFWSLSVVFITKIFDIQNTTLSVLLSMVFVSFPVIASMNSFMFMWDSFAMACFWTCFGVYCWNKYEKGIKSVAACICFVLSIASYQAIFAFAMVLIAYVICVELICGNEFNKTIRKAFRGAICSIFAILFWNIITKIILFARGELYRDEISLSIEDLIYGMRKAYGACWWFLNRGFVFNTYWRQVMLVGVLITTVFFGIAIWNKKYADNDKKLLRIIVIVLAIFMYPILAGYAYVAVPDTERVARLGFANILIFISPFILCDRLRNIGRGVEKEKKRVAVTSIMNLFVCILGVLLTNMFFVIDNSAYMSAFQTYEKEYSLALRVVDRVESRTDYVEGMLVRLVEDGQCNYYNSISWESSIDQYINGMAQSGNISMSTNMGRFIEQFVQTDMNIGWTEVDSSFIDTLECWPSERCIGVDENGVMVVKFENAGY